MTPVSSAAANAPATARHPDHDARLVGPAGGQRITSSGREPPAADVSAVGRLRERRCDDLIDRGREVGTQGCELRRLLAEVRVEGGHLRLSFVGNLAGKALEQHARERVDIGADVDTLALDLLRSDIVNRSDELPGLSETTGPAFKAFRETKSDR